jgi:hypothetical protein
MKFPNPTLLSLLIPSLPQCDFGPCVDIQSDFYPGQGAIKKLNTGIGGYVDLLAGLSTTWASVVSNIASPFTGDKRRLFFTHWCGPGGAGSVTSNVDGACKVHDLCYDSYGLSPEDNYNPNLDPRKKQGIAACNQQLCDAAGTSTYQGRLIKDYFSSTGYYRCH